MLTVDIYRAFVYCLSFSVAFLVVRNAEREKAITMSSATDFLCVSCLSVSLILHFTYFYL